MGTDVHIFSRERWTSDLLTRLPIVSQGTRLQLDRLAVLAQLELLIVEHEGVEAVAHGYA